MFMRIKYHEPYGNPEEKQDSFPENNNNLVVKANKKPKNFGVVEESKLYRSAIIWPHQARKLQEDYGIQHIITLIDGDWLQEFYDDEEITIHQFPLLQRRELTFGRVTNIVDVINSLDGPAIVCCLKGKTRTGMVCAGYRLINDQKDHLGSIIETIKFGNLNISSFREMWRYLR